MLHLWPISSKHFCENPSVPLAQGQNGRCDLASSSLPLWKYNITSLSYNQRSDEESSDSRAEANVTEM